MDVIQQTYSMVDIFIWLFHLFFKFLADPFLSLSIFSERGESKSFYARADEDLDNDGDESISHREAADAAKMKEHNKSFMFRTLSNLGEWECYFVCIVDA